MKKKNCFTRLLALITIVATTVACTNDDQLIDSPQPTNTNTIRATMPTPAGTRMNVTDTGTFGAEELELKWEVGDQIFVCTAGSITAQATYEIATAGDITDEGKTATFTPVGDVSAVNITGGVAYFANISYDNIDLPSSQSAYDTEPFAGQKLPMKAEGIDIINGVCPNDITFKHMAYVFKFSFKVSGALNPTQVSLRSDNGVFYFYNGIIGTSSYGIQLKDYVIPTGGTIYFDVYIPLFAREGQNLGNLTVGLVYATQFDDFPIGSFTAESNSTTEPFKAGYMYSARIEYPGGEAPGKIIESSEFNNDVAGRNAAYLAGINYASGDGTSAASAYEIASADQLKKLIEEVGEGNNYAGTYFKLTKDIHVTADTWTPLGRGEAKTFHGNFDGNGHVISGTFNGTGTTDYFGFFGQIFENNTEITIKNLTVAANVLKAQQMIGGIIGVIRSTKKPVTIENCHFLGNLTGEKYIGGIIGYANRMEAASPVTISNCTSRGSITTNGIASNAEAAGGIAGSFTNYCNITTCTNYAKVTGKSPTVGKIGGIAGSISGNISNSTNYGEIDGTKEIGGIFGYTEATSLIFSNNVNHGKIGNSTATYVGGIAGRDYLGNTYTDNTNNSNDISGSSFVGGLWGYQGNGDTDTGNINTSSVPDFGTGNPYP